MQTVVLLMKKKQNKNKLPSKVFLPFSADRNCCNVYLK